jgi:hypothetical protein
VFQPRTDPRPVVQVRYERAGVASWCDITGLDEGGELCPAMACLVEDSGEGACYVVFGGAWGLRLQDSASPAPWNVADAAQWGVPFLLLAGNAEDLRFQ